MTIIDEFRNGISRLSTVVDELNSKIMPYLPALLTITDAHHVIIGASQLDNALKDALLAKMRQLSRDLRDRIFDGYGPLNTLRAKIDIAYALGVIEDDMYKSLRTINNIRNKFAHTTQYLGFNDQEISNLIDSIHVVDLTIDNKTIRFIKIIESLSLTIGNTADQSTS